MSLNQVLINDFLDSKLLAPITQLRMCVTKIVHIQGRSPNVVSDFQYHKELLL